MKKIIPKKIKRGDVIRIIAPSQSLNTIPRKIINTAVARLCSLGLVVTFSENVNETNEFGSSNVDSRIQDLENSFRDKEVKAIITARGGYNSNELLEKINWEIIRNNPKILVGYSDISVLSNTIFSQTGLVSYSGPNLASLGSEKNCEYTMNLLSKSLMTSARYSISPSAYWDDCEWPSTNSCIKQQNKDKYLVINEGKAEGIILGGNLCSFNLLQGTRFFPSLSNTILFLEEDNLAKVDTLGEFDRNLESLIQQPSFEEVKGIVLGRFQLGSSISNKNLALLLKKKQLSKLPVIANVDFGHTNPKATFPIGGTTAINAFEGRVTIRILEH